MLDSLRPRCGKRGSSSIRHGAHRSVYAPPMKSKRTSWLKVSRPCRAPKTVGAARVASPAAEMALLPDAPVCCEPAVLGGSCEVPLLWRIKRETHRAELVVI